ncbi:MAG: permease prefix domain 1-containing protein [Bacilli bacterium]
MDIIKTYLENLFASLPKTKEVNKMKTDLLLNMEEKYLELKANGKSENEAIGIVISEFGNIEELASELGVNINNDEKSLPTLTMDEAKEFLKSQKRNGKFVSFGVLLCILSPMLIIIFSFMDSFNSNSTINMIIGFVALFVMIAIAVGLFIFAGVDFEKYTYIKKDVYIPNSIKEFVKIEQKNFESKFTLSLVVSVTMFILSPILLIVLAVINDNLGVEQYNLGIGVGVLLTLIALGCFIIIRAGLIKDSHNVLLEIGEYKKAKSKTNNDRIISAIAGIYWPLVIAGYLLWSFLGKAWHISWLVWVIAGVLFGGISELINSKDRG